jgi:hypothetical protein
MRRKLVLISEDSSLKQAGYFKKFGKNWVFFGLFPKHILHFIHPLFDYSSALRSNMFYVE